LPLAANEVQQITSGYTTTSLQKSIDRVVYKNSIWAALA
jgi:hypothetical protein